MQLHISRYVTTGKKVRIKSAQRLRHETRAPSDKAKRKDGLAERTRKAVARAQEKNAELEADRRKMDAKSAQAVAAADQENARLAEERAKSADGRTASERAMAESARDAKKQPKASAKKVGKKRDGMSCLDAAAKVLEESGEPMNTAAMFDAMVAKGYWTSDKATPQNTIYAALLREIARKGDESRFRKSEQRGRFELNR